MPRNSSGTYSLPQASFVAGTTINSAAMNSNLSDIALALTGSMAANGSTTITAPIPFVAGTALLPGITFIGDTNTGIFSTGSGGLAIASDGISVIQIAAGGATTFVSSITATAITVETVIATTSMTAQAINNVTYTDTIVSALPTTPAATHLKTFVKLNNAVTPIAKEYHVSSTGNVYPATGTFGQCRLTVSGGNLLLSPYKGNLVTVNDSVYVIPDAGVSLARLGVTDNTFYYVYLYDNAGTLTLELSTTVYVAQTNTGVMVKTGDGTRTLVGAVYSDVTSFKDTNSTLYTLSYYNRRLKYSQTVFTVNRTYAAVGIGEVNSEIRNNFISWSDEYVSISVTGVTSNNATSQWQSVLLVDGTTSAQLKSGALISGSSINSQSSSTSNWKDNTLTENAVHFATIGSSTFGTVTFYTQASYVVSNVLVQING